MKLDLKRVWKVMNKLSYEKSKLSEENVFVYLLGNSSEYSSMSFDSFLGYYSFRVEDDNIVVFNRDGVPYEDYYNNDFSYLPIELLSFSEEKLENWIENEIEMQLEKQRLQKIAEKEEIKRKIERLTKELNTL